MDFHSKVKTREYEIIKGQYELLDFSITASVDEVKVLLACYQDDMDECILECHKSINKCGFKHQLQAMKTMIKAIATGSKNVGEETSRNTMGLIFRREVLADRFKGFFMTLDAMLTEENASTIAALAEFTNSNFLENMNHLDNLERRDSLADAGVLFVVDTTDTQIAYEEFFNETINAMQVKKTKKKKVKKNKGEK